MSAEPTPIAIAVVEWQDQFLVGRRTAGKPLAGFWEFPGGRVEQHESPADAAVRECFEETGLDVSVVRPYPVVDYQYEHGPVRLFFFACRLQDPRRAPKSPFRWVARRDLSQLEFPPANRNVLNFECRTSKPL